MRRAFTLLEIMIYIAVLAIIFLAVSSFLTWSAKTSVKVGAIREVTDNARRAMEIMVYEIRGGKSIYNPTTTSTQLSLETSRYALAGENASYIDFYLCGESTSTLCLKKESEAPIAITSDAVRISKLVFTKISTTTPSIQVQMSLDYKTSAQGAEYQASIDVTSTASLRSY